MIRQEEPTATIRVSRTRMEQDSRHPWVYAGHIEEVKGEPAGGDVVDGVAPNGRFLARGLYNQRSKIRVRLLTFEKEPISEPFWQDRVAQAVRLRERIVSGTNAYRLLYGEADLLPGLIVDRYDEVLVMQTLWYGMDRRKELVDGLLCHESGVGRMYR